MEDKNPRRSKDLNLVQPRLDVLSRGQMEQIHDYSHDSCSDIARLS